MSETKFTPGPWKIVHEFNVESIDGNRIIAPCGAYYSNINGEKVAKENIANAALIAAAPDMFSSLTELVEMLDILKEEGVKFHRGDNLKIKNAQKALAKARGDNNH